ncbi:MAG: type II toxin-antitoxin system RelE/ParE family toxin [Alphaproteobacteria bacterium]|nr:type II toxin-antitoxin system RelE/ParE family toxin [Alphaproteobacteria bacterium]
MRVLRRPAFLDDLSEAYAWLAPESAQAAERLLDRVDATVARLTDFPLIGLPRETIGPGLRSIRVRPFRHLIFYRVSGDELVLVRLLHGARQLNVQDDEP